MSTQDDTQLELPLGLTESDTDHALPRRDLSPPPLVVFGVWPDGTPKVYAPMPTGIALLPKARRWPGLEPRQKGSKGQ